MALANPATAGYVAAITGAKTLLADELFPAIRDAVKRRELTVEEEDTLHTGAEEFWAGVASGEAFAGSEWRPRTNLPPL